MDNIKEKSPNEQLNEKMREIFTQCERDTLKKMPMWMRYNYILNQLGKAMQQGHTEDDINWDAVNERLYTDILPYDNTMYKHVSTLDELRSAREQCIEASVLDMAWHKGRCKDCHQEFIMSHNEVQFFSKKELTLPKRCKCCRDKRKAGS